MLRGKAGHCVPCSFVRAVPDPLSGCQTVYCLRLCGASVCQSQIGTLGTRQEGQCISHRNRGPYLRDENVLCAPQSLCSLRHRSAPGHQELERNVLNPPLYPGGIVVGRYMGIPQAMPFHASFMPGKGLG